MRPADGGTAPEFLRYSPDFGTAAVKAELPKPSEILAGHIGEKAAKEISAADAAKDRGTDGQQRRG